jgi:hypothetical protein
VNSDKAITRTPETIAKLKRLGWIKDDSGAQAPLPQFNEHKLPNAPPEKQRPGKY